MFYGGQVPDYFLALSSYQAARGGSRKLLVAAKDITPL